MADFRMPSLGADMEAGTLVTWHVKAGDTVKRGDVVADVETDKGIVEVEIWEDGVVDALAIAPGTKVPVGTVLATLRASGAPAADVHAASVATAATRVAASPAARQLARERGIDVAKVRGTGPHEAVTRADVERAVARPAEASPLPAPPAAPPVAAAAPARATGLDAAAMRRAIAAAMTRSKREIPHYYLSSETDVQAATRWLEVQNAARPVADRVLFAALLLKATALAVREVPEVNGFFVDGTFRPAQAIHLGVAISLRGGGLIAPALHDVDRKSVAEVQAGLRDLVTRTRGGKLRSSEMADATLTVTNLGDQGALSVYGVIYPPQVALVGFGRVVERAWAEGGMIGARPVVTATLSGDHRVSDGHRGAAFLAAISALLQHPEQL
jgi:pyruvate dehydrogenase E2 component (dihydrolipoamide acetyltransferase)